MKKMLTGLALLGSIMTAQAAFAADRTMTFAVEDMTCASCPYIVKQSMAAVPGVARVVVSLEAKTAVVTFDDTKTTIAAIAAASAKAGFPARPVSKGS